jgi:hypothetical protein
LIAEGVVRGEGGGVGGRCGFAVSEHGDYYYVVGGESAGAEVEG